MNKPRDIEEVMTDGKKIKEITEELKQTQISGLSGFISTYETDERPGVLKLVTQAQKKLDKYHGELARMEELKYFERKYSDVFTCICGIDEAGRGPLAGPVVAAAAVFPIDTDIIGINDSKKLSEKKREELYDVIMEKAISVGVGMASPERIDEINILQATYEAMRQAIGNLSVKPDLLLNDAVTIPEVDAKQVAIVKGDAKSISIGAASIIAKVTRDRLMYEYDRVMPEYGFAKHKGYGTKEHIEAIQKYGPSPIHRMTFITHFI